MRGEGSKAQPCVSLVVVLWLAALDERALKLPCALNKSGRGIRGCGDPQSQGPNLPDNSPRNDTSAWFLGIFVPVKWPVLKVPILPVICRQFGALNLTSART